MERRILIVAALVFGSSLAIPSTSRAIDVYGIDPVHTSVVFGVGHNNLSFVYGFFRKAQGSYSLDSNPANCRFQFIIDAASIDTNYPTRDKFLQSPDMLDVTRFPQITFKTTSCRVGNTDRGLVYYATGDLTIHGVARQVTLPLQMLADGDGLKREDGTKDRRTAFLLQYELKRSDFEMGGVPAVGNAVGITISFEGILQPPMSTAQRTGDNGVSAPFSGR